MLGKILFYLIQWTWGLPQNLAGLVLRMVSAGKSRSSYRNASVICWRKPSGLSLGMFIFIWEGAPERMLAHEYGHSIQSAILGHLYVFVIGIPSLLWCRIPCLGKKWRGGKKSYFTFFSEKWADHLGKVKKLAIPEVSHEHNAEKR